MLIPIPFLLPLCCVAVLCSAVLSCTTCCLVPLLCPALLFMCPTQNLAHAHMYIWVPDVSKVDVANKTSDLFREFSDYVTVRRYVGFCDGVKMAGRVATRTFLHSAKPGAGVAATAVQQ